MTRHPFLTLALAGCFASPIATPLTAQAVDTLHTAGLVAPVEVVRDRRGISHIYANNEHDLFFTQGYVAARDHSNCGGVRPRERSPNSWVRVSCSATSGRDCSRSGAT